MVILLKKAQALAKLFGTWKDIADINDNAEHVKYPQPTPKARILAALKDLERRK